MNDDDIDFIKKEIEIQLNDININQIILSILINPDININVEKLIKMKKKLLIEIIIKKFNIEIITKHKKYLNSLSLKRESSFSYFQGQGFVPINNYMITKNINIQRNYDQIRKLNEIMTITEKSLENKELEVKLKVGQFKKFITEFIDDSEDKKKKIINAIKDLKYIIKTAPNFSYNIYVYRGENNSVMSFVINKENKEIKKRQEHDNKMLNLKEGDIIINNKFISFSLAPWIALQFSGECCLYRINITPNSNIPFFISPLTQQFKEFEVLLPPMKFKLNKISKMNSHLNKLTSIVIYDISKY